MLTRAIKREEVTKQGFCKILWRKLLPRGSLLLEFIHSSGWGGGERLLSLIGRRRGGRLFEAERLLTFSAFSMGAYSRWALIRGWVLIRINTVIYAITGRVAWHPKNGCEGDYPAARASWRACSQTVRFHTDSTSISRAEGCFFEKSRAIWQWSRVCTSVCECFFAYDWTF